MSGTSAMLLTFDESEVRKIVAICAGVIKYLQVAEVVERMEDLITFVKNLTPGITNMAKQVEARAKELTHVAHADILQQRVASVKKMIPSLISSIKTFVTTGSGKSLWKSNIPPSSVNLEPVLRVSNFLFLYKRVKEFLE